MNRERSGVFITPDESTKSPPLERWVGLMGRKERTLHIKKIDDLGEN